MKKLLLLVLFLSGCTSDCSILPGTPVKCVNGSLYATGDPDSFRTYLTPVFDSRSPVPRLIQCRRDSQGNLVLLDPLAILPPEN